MRPPYLVAVVEDEPGLLADLVEYLGLRGFAASGFASAEDFLAVWPARRFDVLLLDVGLPGMGGLELARKLRARDAAGIIILTAQDSNEAHVQGLDSGADAFLSKRSSLEVIEATCHSVLRRLGTPAASALPATPLGAPATALPAVAPVDSTDPWRLHARQWNLTAPNGTALPLTHVEVVVLEVLFERPGEPITREQLLERLGRQDTLSNLRNLDNTASRLRRKVQSASGIELPVRPSYGKGYTFTGQCEVAR